MMIPLMKQHTNVEFSSSFDECNNRLKYRQNICRVGEDQRVYVVDTNSVVVKSLCEERWIFCAKQERKG